MAILNTAISIVYSHVEHIKNEYLANEQLLKERFNTAGILPIPEDAPVEIPRIVMSTLKEHSQLSISPEAANFQTIYDNDYVSDWDKCAEYLRERMDDVFKLTDILTKNNYSYVGIVTSILYEDISESANTVLFKNLMGKDAPDNLDDFSVKYTYKEDDKYYVNITLQSLKNYGDLNPKTAGELSDNNVLSHNIQITLDINDRFAFNNNKEYTSSKKSFLEVLELTSSIINNKIDNLVKKGEY